MKGFQFTACAGGSIFVALACMLCLNLNTVDAQGYSMQDTCMYVKNNTYIGNPTNCAGWGFCRNGMLLASGNCSSGYLYNTRTGICDYPSNVQCQTTVEQMCASFTSPQFVANPNNCNQYCYCNSTSIECANCPMGQSFQVSTTSCVWNSAASCSANSICRLVQDNAFVQNPAQCGQYIGCYDGSSPNGPQSCSEPSFTYDTSTGTCGPTNTCNAQNIPPSSNGPFPQNTQACTNAASGTYISDGQTCGGFYYCDPTDSTQNGLWGKCPMGTHFNPNATATNGECVSPFTYNCPYNRCMNLNQSYVAEPGCLTFSYCQNQQTVIKGLKCTDVNTATPYFNEYYGSCMATNANVTICSP
jgi:hypothetical protein